MYIVWKSTVDRFVQRSDAQEQRSVSVRDSPKAFLSLDKTAADNVLRYCHVWKGLCVIDRRSANTRFNITNDDQNALLRVVVFVIAEQMNHDFVFPQIHQQNQLYNNTIIINIMYPLYLLANGNVGNMTLAIRQDNARSHEQPKKAQPPRRKITVKRAKSATDVIGCTTSRHRRRPHLQRRPRPASLLLRHNSLTSMMAMSSLSNRPQLDRWSSTSSLDVSNHRMSNNNNNNKTINKSFFDVPPVLPRAAVIVTEPPKRSLHHHDCDHHHTGNARRPMRRQSSSSTVSSSSCSSMEQARTQ